MTSYIEAVEKLIDQQDDKSIRIRELEAKLDKAAAGLRKIADHKHFSRDQGWTQNAEARIASATLRELEK
jgi:hypothetical protein